MNNDTLIEASLLAAYLILLAYFSFWRERSIRRLISRQEELSREIDLNMQALEFRITTLKNLQSSLVTHRLSTSEPPTKVGS